MNPEQQRTAIAEACGFYDIANGYGWVEFKGGQLLKKLPDYLNDLNAMHEAEKMLTDWQSSQYEMYLMRSRIFVGAAEFWTYHATAAHRAEAFLRAIGKWEDHK